MDTQHRDVDYQKKASDIFNNKIRQKSVNNNIDEFRDKKDNLINSNFHQLNEKNETTLSFDLD